jgi:hypothetical protein
MAEDGKTLKDIAEERGIELTEIDLDEVDLGTHEAWPNLLRFDATKIEERPEGYDTLACWPAIVVETDDVEDVQEFFEQMGAKKPVHMVGCEFTEPTKGEEGTGGRSDFFFYFHRDDIVRVAVRRLMHGIRWWEDVVANEAEDVDNAQDYDVLTIYHESIHEVCRAEHEWIYADNGVMA